MTLHNELRAAVNNEAFELHYQPVVSLADGESSESRPWCVGGHRQPRCATRTNSSSQPRRRGSSFRSVHGCSGGVPRREPLVREPRREASVTVAVNVSPRQFAQPDLVDQVRSTIAETGIRPELLTLELTESMTMGDADHAAEVLHQLRDLGVRISIDDFGTGFSCLSYLHRFPLQVLKIDRSFIARMETHMEAWRS